MKTSSSLSTQQLIDSLTSHIALYHSHSHSHSHSPNPSPNPNPRSPILRWLSSLPTPTRRSILTFTDPKFTQTLIQMQAHLASNGPSLFFLLPDLPSDPLCTRRCHGLLARRMAMAPSSISSNLLLFGLRDESVLDSVMVGEELVGDLDGFVRLMDEVTNGRFLRGEEAGLGEEWKELGWLKEKGYYSLEEFVANRLEVILRRSWGRRKGKKGVGGEGVGESTFWRRNGCVDWWMGIEVGKRREFCLGFLGKAAKPLANEIVVGKNTILRNKCCFFDVQAEWPKKYGPTTSWERSKTPFLRSGSDACLETILGSGMPHNLAKLLNRLLVLQEVSAIVQACQLNKVEKETLFFSRLGSVLTVSDYTMRKFRGLIMAVSIDFISRELLGDEKLNSISNKNEKKLSVASRKGKKKCRKPKQKNSKPADNSALPDPTMHNECMADCATDDTCKLCHQEDNNPIAAHLEIEEAKACALPKDLGKEHAIISVDSKGPADRKRSRGKGAKRKHSSSKKVAKPEIEGDKTSIPCISAGSNVKETVELAETSTPYRISSDPPLRNTLPPMSTSCGVSFEPCILDTNKMGESAQVDHSLPFSDDCSTTLGCHSRSDKFGVVQPFARDEKNTQSSPCIINSNNLCVKLIDSLESCLEIESSVVDNERMLRNTRFINRNTLKSIPSKCAHAAMNEQGAVIQNDSHDSYVHNHINPTRGTSYEWPSLTPLHLTSSNSPHLPAATDRLHLEVGHRQPNHFHHSFMPSRNQVRNPSADGGQGRIVPSLTSSMSCDWPPVVKNCGRLDQAVTISYDSAFNPPLPHSFCSGFAAHVARGMQINGPPSENERKHSGDVFDFYDVKTASDFRDDTESYWLSEEESDTHAISGRDYNQFFGGGIMYWNPGEYVGTGFSRPPSHSSEDSSWAWYEADLNRAIDDMVGMPALPSSFNATGLASPPAASFCSPFDPMGAGHQPIGYTVPGNDSGKVLPSSATDVPEERSSVSLNNLPSCVEGVKADTLPYAMLRPIIVPRMSREGSRSEFKFSLDHNSPCLPSNRCDHPRSKRPPSPVVLCVPRVPRPPPPSPVGESRKRGFPIVRSGSSSPRQWGMKNFYHEDGNIEEPRLCLDGAEVVWPSWGTRGLAGTPVAQSIQGSLLQNHLISISQRSCDQEHPDVALPLQPPHLLNCPHKASLSLLHNHLHEEIDFFCKKVAAENLIKKPYINWAVKRVTRSLQDLWPRSRTNIFGSNATGLALPTSDVDLVVSLPPVRNLEPIKEAGILEGRNGIKETCLQHAARYLANQDWVRNDSLKTIENTTIPIIMLMAEVPQDINCSNGYSCVVEVQSAKPPDIPADSACHSDHLSSEDNSFVMCSTVRKDGGIDVKSVRLDISFKSHSHTGLQTSKLVRELTQQFPASVPLALILKKFLADRSLDHSYSGGLSSYCLVLLITRFLQHEHHVGWPVSQNLGSLFMDFLYFFGNVFNPRQMRISIQGSGVYVKRERGLSIDPIHIDDPLFPSNNVGRNCFRIHQCIKAFADAYTLLENELSHFSDDSGRCLTEPFELLRKIIPNIDQVE